MTLAVSQGFLLEFATLQRPVREKVGDLIRKFHADPSAKGINLEKLTETADPRSRTVRVNKQYRAVVVAPEMGNTYILIGVHPHDDAYAWCARNRIQQNAIQGAIEIEDVIAVEQALSQARTDSPTEPATNGFFANYSDRDLTNLGIEDRFLALIRGVTDEDGALTLSEILPTAQGAALAMLAAGYTVEAAWSEVTASTVAPTGQMTVSSLDEAITQPWSRSMFHVVEDDADLERLLAQPLALWRVFLHPSQQRVALRHVYTGPARVSGGAGTGKTVVLLHRVKLLAESNTTATVLVTTFTRNLAADLGALLEGLGGSELRSRVDVLNIDAVAPRILRGRGGTRFGVCGDDDERAAFADAVTRTGVSYPSEVVRQEWRQVVLTHAINDEARYLAIPRPGRGIRLGRPERAAMWTAISAAVGLIGERKTFLQLADHAASVLNTSGERPYDHVFVDEAQDLHPTQWRLVRALVPSGPNDIFIAGDPYQRIYGHRVSLSRLGIDVRGRSTRLNLNYRSTQEILQWSTALLRGETYEDLDESKATLRLYRSRLRGPVPQLFACTTADDELRQLVATVRRWVEDGVDPADIAVAARTNALVARARQSLESSGVPAVVLTADRPVQVTTSLSLGTMHRLKGLEFRCVAVIGCSARELPAYGTITSADVDPVGHKEDLQRERSLLYVACTRARDELAISWSGRPSLFLPADLAAAASAPVGG